jgi:hypothetical protein
MLLRPHSDWPDQRPIDGRHDRPAPQGNEPLPDAIGIARSCSGGTRHSLGAGSLCVKILWRQVLATRRSRPCRSRLVIIGAVLRQSGRVSCHGDNRSPQMCGRVRGDGAVIRRRKRQSAVVDLGAVLGAPSRACRAHGRARERCRDERRDRRLGPLRSARPVRHWPWLASTC